MTEEVNTGGLQRFVYEKRKFSEEEDTLVRQKWGSPPSSVRNDYDPYWGKIAAVYKKDYFWFWFLAFVLTITMVIWLGRHHIWP